jgi:hypothetical protein
MTTDPRSALAQHGWWNEDGQCWYIEPAERLEEDTDLSLLVIGRPGVDGIRWGYRQDMAGIWAHYPIDDDFVWLAKSADELHRGYAEGRISV